MLTVRCSSLPLLAKCSASLALPGPVIDTADDSATLGTATHWVLASWVQAGRPSDAEVDEAVLRFGVDGRELQALCGMGWACWWKVREHFPNPQVEVEMGWADTEAGIHLTGHADVLSIVGDEVRVLDWKTGREDADHEDQLRGYALLGLMSYMHRSRTHESLDAAYVSVVRVRDQSIDGWRYTERELWHWYVSLIERLKDTGRYRPGEHCRYCPKGASCEAKTALLAQAATAIAGSKVSLLAMLPDDLVERGRMLGELLYRAKLVKGMAEVVADLVKADVAAHGGVMPYGDRQLVIERSGQRKIDFGIAWPVLEEVLSPDQLTDCVTFSKGSLEAAVKDGAPRGEKSKAWMELMSRLESAGAVTTTWIERLEVSRSTKAIKE